MMQLELNRVYTFTLDFNYENQHFQEKITCIVRKVDYIGSNFEIIEHIEFDQIIDLEDYLNNGKTTSNTVARTVDHFRPSGIGRNNNIPTK